MASVKSAETLDREVSQAHNNAATLKGCREIIAAQAAKIADQAAELSRKEIWINRYAAQLKAARSKVQAPAVNDFAAKSALRKEAAIALGQELGRGATGAEVDAYLNR